jgi:Fur family transcriptional regulator, iron response regulator
MLRSGDARKGAAIQKMLRNVGMRPTRQRIALVSLLDKNEESYVTAKILYEKALEARCPVSRATVCNALRQFKQAGLLRRITVHGSKTTWFGHQSVGSSKGKKRALGA